MCLNRKKYIIYKIQFRWIRYYTADSTPGPYANYPTESWSTEIEHGKLYTRKEAKAILKSRNGGVIVLKMKRI